MPADHGQPSQRLPWVDNLRTLLILLVVNLHACVTYSHVGSWYVKEPPEPGAAVKSVFILWECHLQAFFMGLLFFLAGFFAHFSLERRGIKKFLGERWLRLGIPLLGYVFLIHPFIVFILQPWGKRSLPLLEAYGKYLKSGRFMESTGPLWFAEALLLFCGAFALIRMWQQGRAQSPASSERWTTLRSSRLLLVGIGLATASFLVRLVQPIGMSVLNLQLCFFPQYIVAFSLGVLVAKHFDLNSLARLPAAKRFGWAAITLGPLVLAGITVASIPEIRPNHAPSFFGGWNPLALAFAGWEQCAAVGLSLGIMALAWRRWNSETAWSRWLSERSFGVYVIHTPVLIALTMAMRGLQANPFAKAGLLTVLGLAGSYLAVDLLRRIPGVRAVFT